METLIILPNIMYMVLLNFRQSKIIKKGSTEI